MIKGQRQKADTHGLSEIREIVETYRQRVFQTAYGIVQDIEDAKDITQDVFLKVLEKMDTFKGNASFSTWVYRITVNTCIDLIRKRKHGTDLEFDEGINYKPSSKTNLVSLPNSPFESAYQTEIRKKITEAFMKLSPEHRSALVLREIEGLSYQQISDVLGCSLGTVMSRLHYARKKMQKFLAPIWEGSK